MIKALIPIVLGMMLSSCAMLQSAGVTSEGINKPLAEIQQIVVGALPLGKKQVSLNGREFWSEYFRLGKKKVVSAETSSKRLQAHITILGDRRPYTIRVVVYRQKRISSRRNPERKYEQVGTDKRLAKALLRRIQNRLTKRRDDRNIIDDFRVF